MDNNAKQPIKIAYIFPSSLQEQTHEGGQTQQRQILINLMKAGHRLTVITRQHAQAILSSYDLESWQQCKMPISDSWIFRKLSGGIWKLQQLVGIPYLNIFTNLRLFEVCARIFPGHNLCFERVGAYSVGPALATYWRAIPYILFFDADILFEQDYAGTPITGIQRTAVAWMQRMCLHQARAVICVSEASKRHVTTTWNVDQDKVYVLLNAVDTEKFKPISDVERTKARYSMSIPNKQFVIMFVGSFQPWHDWSSLIRAFCLVNTQLPNSQLVFVGDGPGRSAAEGQVHALKIQDRVTFIGEMHYEDINNALGAADVLVAPYPSFDVEFWGSPMKLFEYMAAGKAIIAASVGQLAYIVRHRETGLLYEPGNIQMLADSIIELYEDPTLRNKLGNLARRQAIDEHSWERYIEKLETIFNSVVCNE